VNALEKWLLNNVPTPWLALSIVVISVALALGGFVLVRKHVDHGALKQQHDVAGFLIAVIGVIYAVLLGFVVVVQWQSFSDAETTGGNEAAAIGNLYRDAVALGPAGVKLRAATGVYAREIAYVEYPYMAKHETEAPTVDAARNEMWKEVRQLRAPDATAQQFVQQAVVDVSAATQDRRERVRESASELPISLWVVLIVGGVLTVGFCYFFSLESFAAQATMIGILATLVGIALFVILSLDFPFTGSVANGPDALVREINEFCSYDFVHPLRSARCDAR
jgi:hypothetical protein